MLLAYKVRHILVFATRGTEAKLLAAPLLESNEYWHENVDKWVALRAERSPELDALCDPQQSAAYVQPSS